MKVSANQLEVNGMFVCTQHIHTQCPTNEPDCGPYTIGVHKLDTRRALLKDITRNILLLHQTTTTDETFMNIIIMPTKCTHVHEHIHSLDNK